MIRFLQRSILWSCLALWAACSTTEYTNAPTQVLLQLSCEDDELLANMQSLLVQVSTLENGVWQDAKPLRLDAGALQWPLEIPIVSRRGASSSRVFQVVVQALADGQALAETRAVSRFSPSVHKVLKRELYLCPNHSEPFVCTHDVCSGESCAVCSKSGECEPVGFEDELEDPLEAMDGGAPAEAGASVQDGGSSESDAGPLQGRMDASGGDAARDAEQGMGRLDAATDSSVTDANADATVLSDASDGMTALECDEDKDGYYAARAECNALRGSAPSDCDDKNKNRYPGAAVVCGDGLRNDCSAWDSNAELFLGLSEATFLPEKPLEILPAEYLVHWAFAVGRVGGAAASTAVALRLEPLTSGGGAGEVQLRMFPASGSASAAIVGRPADLSRWVLGPQPVWTGSAFAFRSIGVRATVGDAPLEWTWNGTDSTVTAPYGTLPSGCTSTAASGRLQISADKQAWAALLGDVQFYFGTTYSRCMAISGTIESMNLAGDRTIVGGDQTSVLIWDLSPSAPVAYTLAHPRVRVLGSTGLSAASPFGGTLTILYSSLGGVTVELVDVASGPPRRAFSLDIPHTSFGLREVAVTTISPTGILVSLFGTGDPNGQGQLPGMLRSIVLRTQVNQLTVVSDLTLNLKDGPYQPPVVQVVGPSVTESWYDAVFLRQVGNELRQGRVRYCSKL